MPTAHDLDLAALAVYLHEADRILVSWDTWADRHTDTDGWPHDADRYGERAAQRDADIWRAFSPVRQCAGTLINTARRQVKQLPQGDAHDRWSHGLDTLASALERIDALEAERAGASDQEEAVFVRNEEAWPALDDWAVHGHVLIEIDVAAQQRNAASPPSPAPRPRQEKPRRRR
ncbi:hypothetical protein ACL02R_11610 [Streptomyces sp. MS19]|uniref:hypothetical protein n=1 Tax=Streptomyces sp. MS19 TaxID=3385972 RepID=UPI0039A31874